MNKVFNEQDEIEKRLGLSVEELSHQQLLTYFEWGMSKVLGVNIVPGGTKQSSIMKSLQERYGKANAGKMVKWAVFVEKGYYKGERLSVSSWAAGNKWLTDEIFTRVQLDEKKPDSTQRSREIRKGFLNLKDL